ncbi:AAA family ATPase [Thalassospira sp. SN3W]|uniref:AAA family ATPase n=1 Tax=Thalassospira sp. SN3W TaxID=3035476 RepID=UPI00311AF21C
MQYFDRTKVPPPKAFQGKAATTERQELLSFLSQDSARQAQTSPPSRYFKPDQEVIAALDKLFRSKCAFCEARTHLNVQLFRPPEQATPLATTKFAHLYYAWLRTDWTNHYPVCDHCSVRSGRDFPVRSNDRGRLPTVEEFKSFAEENYGLWRYPHKDKKLLIDPCKDRSYISHFSVDLSGRLQPISKAAFATIQTFGLDRTELNVSRAHSFDQYLHLLLSEFERGIHSSVLEFEQLEFGGTWYLLLRRLLIGTAKKLGRPIKVTRENIRQELKNILRTDIGRNAMRECIENIHQPEMLKPVRAKTRQSGPPPRLTSIELENFKSLERIKLTVPEPISTNPEREHPSHAAALLVLGENASGKSSLLESVALALCGEAVRTNIGKSAAVFILDPNLMGANGERKPAYSSVTLKFDYSNENKLIMENDFHEDFQVLHTPPVFAYGAFRQYSSSPKRTLRLGHVGTLFEPSVVLPNPEKWLLSLNEARFSMVVRALREILSIDGEFDVIEPDRVNNRCFLVTQVEPGQSGTSIRTPLEIASSGYRSVLAMVCDILEGLMGRSDRNLRPLDEQHAVILIDEIEAHLHPRWKMQIMAAIRRILPNSLIIATSHDPLCVRGMHNGEVVVFNRAQNLSADHIMPFIIEERTKLHNFEEMTIEQLLTSDLFEMFTTDSPTVEREFARLADILARQDDEDSLSEDEKLTLAELKSQVDRALPLGTSKVQQLISSAIHKFLVKRRDATKKELDALEEDVRQQIVSALESI